MKKNRMMRLASGLLVAVLLTTSVISGTFAKYVSEAEGFDQARVAKWGVDVVVDMDETFKTTYEALPANAGIFAETVVSSNSDKLVAPGTNGELLSEATISGTPEVAVNVKKEATLELLNWEVDGSYYCPLVITVDGTEYKGTAYQTVGDFIAAVTGALNEDVNYEAGHTFDDEHSVLWRWDFEGGDGQDNGKDSDLGDYAAKTGDIEIKFGYKVTVTQID